MKLFSAVILAVAAFSQFALASGPTMPVVKITSFAMVDNIPRLGEVCGVVQNNDVTSLRLSVVADPKTSSPGNYHVITGLDGTFCELINTYTGTVRVDVMGAPTITPVYAEAKNSRQ
jgi:hypothetical protein